MFYLLVKTTNGLFNYQVYHSKINLELDNVLNMYSEPIALDSGTCIRIADFSNYYRYPIISTNGLPSYKQIEQQFEKIDHSYEYYILPIYIDGNITISQIFTNNDTYTLPKLQNIDIYTILNNMSVVKILPNNYITCKDIQSIYQSYVIGDFNNCIGGISPYEPDKIICYDKSYQLSYDYYHIVKINNRWLFEPSILDTIYQTNPNELLTNKFLINTEQIFIDRTIFYNYQIARTKIWIQLSN